MVPSIVLAATSSFKVAMKFSIFIAIASGLASAVQTPGKSDQNAIRWAGVRIQTHSQTQIILPTYLR